MNKRPFTSRRLGLGFVRLEPLEARLMLSGAYAVTPVVLQREHAPGTDAGVLFNNITQGPTLSDNGQVAFHAVLEGPGVTEANNTGLWSGGVNALNLLVREGQAGVFTGDGVGDLAFNVLSTLRARGNNLVTFSVTSADGSRLASLKAVGGAVSLIGEQGGPAAGGSTLNSISLPFMNDSGQLFYTASVLENNQGKQILVLGNTRVAKQGDPLGNTGKAFFGVDSFYGITDNGDAMFAARLGSARPSLLRMSNGSVTELVDPNTIADGTTFNFGAIQQGDTNGQGQVAFEAILQGPSTNFGGVWVASGPGQNQLLIRQGEPAPGSRGDFFDAIDGSLVINDAGQVAMLAVLKGSGINGSNDRALLAGSSGGGLQLVAEVGMHAPDTPDGVVFKNDIGPPQMNAAGQMVFTASLSGPGVNSGNDFGIWVTDSASGAPRLVVREGDTLQAAPGVVGVVSNFALGGEPNGGSDGRASAINAQGQIAFKASLSGTGISIGQVIFVADTHTPAPTGGSLGDFVWADLDSDGVQDAGEPGLEGVTVELYRTTDGTAGNGDDVLVTSVQTNGAGAYTINGIAPGQYYVQFEAPVQTLAPTAGNQGGDDARDSDAITLGAQPANPTSRTAIITVAAGTNNVTLDAGFLDLSDHTGPTLQVNLSNIVAAGAEAYTFTVTYDDPAGVNTSTIDNLDIVVSGPNYSQPATLFGRQGTTATYLIPAPLVQEESVLFGPAVFEFTAAHNGTYTVTLNQSAVSDLEGNSTGAAHAIGTFAVNIVDTTPPQVELSGGPYVAGRQGIIGQDTIAGVIQVSYFDRSGLKLDTVGKTNVYLREVTSAGAEDPFDTLEFNEEGFRQFTQPLPADALLFYRHDMNSFASTLVKPENEGNWDVFVRGNEVKDQLNNAAAADVKIGTVLFDFTGPTGTLERTFGPASATEDVFQFDVTWRDTGSGVHLPGSSTLALGVRFPDGSEHAAIASPPFDETLRPQAKVTYTLTRPGEENWAAGEYQVSVSAGSLRDGAGNDVAAGAVGVFQYAEGHVAQTSGAGGLDLTSASGKKFSFTVSKDNQDFIAQLAGQHLLEKAGKKGRKAIDGAVNAIQQILATPANAKATVKITSPKAGDRLEVQTIQVNGSSAQFIAPALNLSGAGSSATFTGKVNKLQLGDVRDEHVISIGPQDVPSDKVSITLDRVANTNLVSLTPIDVLTVTEWIDDDGEPDTITAPWIGKIIVKGNAKAGIAGDFEADLVLAGDEAVKLTLGSISVAGDIQGSNWEIAGNVGAVTVGGSVGESTWDITGDVTTFKTGGNASGAIAAHAIKAVTVGGDLVDATISLWMEADIKLNALGALTVKGSMLRAIVDSMGNIGSVTTGKLIDSTVFAGVRAGYIGELPDTKGAFANGSVLTSLKVVGIKGQTTPSLQHSFIAASALGTISLLDLPTDGSASGGVAGIELLKSYSRKAGKVTAFTLKGYLLETRLIEQVDGFSARLL